MKWPFQKRASLEDPNTSISADNVAHLMGGAFGTSNTASKIKVTPESAETLSAVYAAIGLLSETVAQLPLNLHERTDNGSKIASAHPLNDLVSGSPNEENTSFVWRETVQAAVLGFGNGYSYISRGKSSGMPKAIELLDPANTRPARDGKGKLIYITTINGKEFVIPAADILHIPARTRDGITGISPIRAHAETIGLGIAATKFGAEFFGNGASLGGVLEVEKGLGKEAKQALKDSWEKLKAGGYQGVAVLEEGLKYRRIGIPPNEAQFLETRRFQVSEVARIFNIPPHMLRDLEKSSFSNISEQSIEFMRYSMTPWVIKWEQELNRKLLTREDRAKYYFKFNINGLLRGTQQQRYESYQTGILTGFLSRNEARQYEDINTIEGLDEYLIPLNMAPEGQEQEEPEADPSRALNPVSKRAAEALSNWLGKVTDNANGSPENLASRLSKGLDDAVIRHAVPVIESRCLLVGGDPKEKEGEFRTWLLNLPPFEPVTEIQIFEALTK